MASKFVKLSKPVDLHGKSLMELELKEPTGGDYVRLGDPRILVFNASGSGYWVERDDVIRGYFEKCLVSDLGADIANMLTIEDIMRCKSELFLFFSVAAEKVSATESTPLSSAPAS